MKLNNTRTITGNLGSLESHRVSIAANGKAFSTLVKGIYENKIRAFVREISTNALDSHIEAGIPDEPFHVSFPDILDPYFRVRDYGVSMDHDTVFNVFGTLFESTKDDSNDVVGAFGLGSKSPLAYADSFNVTAYLDGDMRLYLVSIDETGAPNISLVSQTETDKPNGIEVAVPIREADFNRVADEGRSVLSAFDVIPTCNIDLEKTKRLFSLSDGSAYITVGGSRLYVRQGCVMYPVNDWDITSKVSNAIKYNYSLVLDVPIGTVGVTTSREALELDEKTRAYLIEKVGVAIQSIGTELNETIASMPNFLEATRYVFENREDSFWSSDHIYDGRTITGWLDLKPMKTGSTKAWRSKLNEILPKVKYGNRRELGSMQRMHINAAQRALFILDYTDRKVVRSNLRYREAVANHGSDNTYLIVDPSPKFLERLIRVFGVTRDQIKWVGSLDDPGPTKRGERRTGTTQVSGVTTPGSYENVKVTELPEEYYWVEVNRPDYSDRAFVGNLLHKIVDNGGDDLPILMFSSTAVKRYKPSAEMNANTVKSRVLSDMEDELRDILINSIATSGLSRIARDAVGATVNDAKVDLAYDYFDISDREEIAEEAAVLRNSWKEKFPLLIDPTDDDWSEYIKDRQADDPQ